MAEKTGLMKILRALIGAVEEEEKVEQLEKDAGELVWLERQVPIAKVDEERRIVYGVVYEPEVEDAHGDGMSAEEIEKAAHSFMSRYGKSSGHLGTDHLEARSPEDVTVIESWVAPEDFDLGEQRVTKGSWVLGAKVEDEEIWAGVKSKRFRGWSFEGWGRRVAA